MYLPLPLLVPHRGGPRGAADAGPREPAGFCGGYVGSAILDANADKFSERGIGIHQFEDDLRAARYTPRTYMGTNWETLQTVVNRGPAVAYVEWEWKPGGVAHGVVVTDANDKEVHVADPGTGTEYAVPTPQFQQSWKSQGNVLYGVEPFWKSAKDKESKKAPPPWRTGRKPGR